MANAADYTAALQGLLPQGRVWPSDPASNQAQALAALAEAPAALDAAALALLEGSLPGGFVDIIPEWEATLGLPDPCAGPDPSLADQAAQISARFIGGGGQSRAFFIAFAAALGFTITITSYAPFRIGISNIETPLYGPEWVWGWGISIEANTGGLSNAVLLCELNTIKPAHTVVFIE